MTRRLARTVVLGSLFVVSAAFGASAQTYNGPKDIINVSYDVARELYIDLDQAFIAEWKDKTGQSIEVKQSHSGSSRQARSILEGLAADVVTFNQVTDVQTLHDQANLIPAGWRKRLPNNSSPYYSLPSFLVRAGNPKNIRDWDDLVRPDVRAVFPNPRTSGNGRYSYLAAYAYALEQSKGDQSAATEFVRKMLANVPVFDTGGRGSTTSFVERGLADVLITFEAEVQGIKREYGDRKLQVVTPSVSLLAEFPVTVVDKVVDRRGSRILAEAYLKWLYEPTAQEILAKNFNRVHDPKVVDKHKDQFPQVRLVTVEDVFGGWDQAMKVHFAEGGILDQVFVNR
ncbi:MAG TPA: thiosulfate ABC transporter substrate-binding protein CysP [Alphaproteobacteria bacterium]|nr:thiosulfate ABC transporter substrate-binding protein CysP [Alphaproteobacteria bacterium]